VLKNHDDVPQMFGPVLIMPGETFQLPFRKASNYQFLCTAHASGQLSVVVEPMPKIGWERFRWRVGLSYVSEVVIAKNMGTHEYAIELPFCFGADRCVSCGTVVYRSGERHYYFSDALGCRFGCSRAGAARKLVGSYSFISSSRWCRLLARSGRSYPVGAFDGLV